MLHQLVFRSPRSDSELLELFRVRQRLIRQTRHQDVLPDSHLEISIDPWDPYAYHYGLFIVDSDGQRPVGYQRGVMAELGPHAARVQRIAAKFSVDVAPRPAVFPFLAIFEGTAHEVLEEFERDQRARGGRFAESTFLVIDPALRPVRVGRFMVDAILAVYFLHLGFETGIAVVSTHHAAFYRRAGFHPLLDKPVFAPKARQDSMPLVASPSYINSRTRSRVEECAAELKAHDYISMSLEVLGDLSTAA